MTLTVATQRATPLTLQDCTTFTFIAKYSLVLGVPVTKGPTCTLNADPSTGAKVVVVFQNNSGAVEYLYAVSNTSSTANTITGALLLPCGVTTVSFSGPSPSAVVPPATKTTVYSSANLASLRCLPPPPGGVATAALVISLDPPSQPPPPSPRPPPPRRASRPAPRQGR